MLVLSSVACMNTEGNTNIGGAGDNYPITHADSLIFTKGDVVAFYYDSTSYGSGFIDEITKDEGGIWYKLIFSDLQKQTVPDINEFRKSRVFGRKILSSLSAKGYEIGLDGEFVLDSCINYNKEKFILIGKIKPRKAEYHGGSYGVSTEYPDLIDRYKLGLQNRMNPPEDYRDVLKSKRTEEYFEMSDIIN